MEKEMISKIIQMLKAPDNEMRELGLAIFCENSNNYEDYWELRTSFDVTRIQLDEPQRGLFNRIFDTIDRETVQPFLDKIKSSYNHTTMEGRIGRHRIIEKSCIIASKEEQSKQIKNKR